MTVKTKTSSIKRKVTKIVMIGKLGIGGNNPMRIKGMLKTPISNLKGLIREAKELETEGAEAIRLAVRDKDDVSIVKSLRKHISLPLVADIHFQPELALRAIKEGFEAIRLNPLNISCRKDVKKIARLAKDYGISIRIGVNSGGFKKNLSPLALAKTMAKKVKDYVDILEDESFSDIMVSLKGSDVVSTIEANKIFSKKSKYPLHLGVTATGPFTEGASKSCVGLGCLLYQGVGDVIRVSLTAPSFWEIRVAKYILQSLNLRKFGPEIISCPTCSRCEVDLIGVVDKFKKDLKASGFKKPLKIALMGCVVNGPGEAYQADIGVAFGKKKAVIFKKDKILKYSNEKRIIVDLMKEVRKIWK